MIYGIGIDNVEISRIIQAVEHNAKFAQSSGLSPMCFRIFLTLFSIADNLMTAGV